MHLFNICRAHSIAGTTKKDERNLHFVTETQLFKTNALGEQFSSLCKIGTLESKLIYWTGARVARLPPDHQGSVSRQAR
jgi:hypothetical protein